MEDLGVIHKGDLRTSIEGKRYKEIPYQISVEYPAESRKELLAFELIIDKLTRSNKKELVDLIPVLLGSKFVNKLIEKYKFISIVEVLRGSLISESAYNSLLNLPGFKKELERYPNAIREKADFYNAPMIAFNLAKHNLIPLLKSFNSIDAVIFYRETVKDTYGKLLRETNHDFLSESLMEFIDLDIYLSPFTSYPVNNPILLLFNRPFERLYNDACLIDESDYERFIQRAYVIYSNFGQILAEGMHYLLWERDVPINSIIHDVDKPIEIADENYRDELEEMGKDFSFDCECVFCNTGGSLDTILKASIFYWNIASRRIDMICEMLNYAKDLIGSRKLQVFNSIEGVSIIDLETNMHVFGPNETAISNGAYFLTDIMLEDSKDPFLDFRPCYVFNDIGVKAEIKSYEDLYEELDRNPDYVIRE